MISFKAISLSAVTFFFFFSSFSFAFSGLNSNSNDFLLEFGNKQSSGVLSTKNPLRMIVWNVQKIENPRLYSDFKMISDSAPLVLFQEMVSKADALGPLVSSDTGLEWNMAKAWRRGGGDYTGVATGSRVSPMQAVPLISDVTEPLALTPKSALLSYFSLDQGARPLLVVNVHAINFVTLRTYSEHMRQIYSAIQSHQGPLVVAGDFNTWSPGRRQLLLSMTKKLGLQEVGLPDNGKFLSLDHVFIRGLRSSRVYDLHRVNSSDHVPLLLELEFVPQAEVLASAS